MSLNSLVALEFSFFLRRYKLKLIFLAKPLRLQ